MARPIWSGAISFGIVNIPVKLYPAVRDRQVHFHQISERQQKRVRYKKVAEGSEKELPNEDIVKGFELARGQYVVIEEQEFKALAARKSKSIDIIDFVSLEEIDPLFFEQPYHVVPDERAGRSYRLLVEALEQSGKVAIAQFVMRSQEHLVALRPLHGVLCLETMRYHDELVPADQVAEIPPQEKVQERELKIARQLIDSMTTTFDPERYKDEYRERLLALIERKRAGQEVAVIEEGEEQDQRRPGKVLDLMAALEASLQDKLAARGKDPDQPGKGRGKAARSARAGKPAAKGGRARRDPAGHGNGGSRAG